jgi:isopentenyl phosphate kinase
MTGKGGSVTQQRYEPKVIDDDELAESIRQVQQERSTRLLLVVLGISAALAVGASAVYLAYSDQPDSVREIEAAQPGVR